MVLPKVIPDERITLVRILEELRVSGGWVPKKPEQTVYNFGHDIKDEDLPNGVWKKIFTLPEEYGPFIVYWKTLVAETPYLTCMSYMDGRPTSPRGIDLKDLYDYGVWQANNRVWCHLYDTTTSRYGLTFNIVEPLTGEYDFYILNHDPDGNPHKLTYIYLNWYQWEKRRIVKVG